MKSVRVFGDIVPSEDAGVWTVRVRDRCDTQDAQHSRCSGVDGVTDRNWRSWCWTLQRLPMVQNLTATNERSLKFKVRQTHSHSLFRCGLRNNNNNKKAHSFLQRGYHTKTTLVLCSIIKEAVCPARCLPLVASVQPLRAEVPGSRAHWQMLLTGECSIPALGKKKTTKKIQQHRQFCYLQVIYFTQPWTTCFVDFL